MQKKTTVDLTLRLTIDDNEADVLKHFNAIESLGRQISKYIVRGIEFVFGDDPYTAAISKAKVQSIVIEGHEIKVLQ